MLSQKEISDRIEIQEILVRYCNAVDTCRLDRLDQVFLPDSYIDYRPYGGIDGRYPEIKIWLKNALSKVPIHQHMIGNIEIEFTEDAATGRALCFNAVGRDGEEGGTRIAFLGLWYIDTYVRAPFGWRIRTRAVEQCYTHNLPIPFPPSRS